MTSRRVLIVVLGLISAAAGPLMPARAAGTATATTAAFTFVPPVLTIAEGDSLVLDNVDVAPHNLTAVDGSSFYSADVLPGATGEVSGVPELVEGRYPFYCTLHPWMQGVLDVGTAPTPPLLPVPV